MALTVTGVRQDCTQEFPIRASYSHVGANVCAAAELVSCFVWWHYNGRDSSGQDRATRLCITGGSNTDRYMSLCQQQRTTYIEMQCIRIYVHYVLQSSVCGS